MSGWVPIWAGVATVGAGFGSWAATAGVKGPNRVLYRSCALLTLTCCYMMWAIVYLAQLHPIIKPKRSDVRFED